MPDTDGVTLLKEWSTAGLLSMPVIMMSGHATIDTAVDATRIGAFAFLEKPITLQKLLKAVEQGLARENARRAAASVVPATANNLATVVTTLGRPCRASTSTGRCATHAMASRRPTLSFISRWRTDR
jgi:DNA-binding NtrC family response regulator